MPRTLSLVGLVLLALATIFPTAVANAQFVEWVDETETRIDAAAGVGIDDTQEKDYAVGDLDQDGDSDLVCVRKQPFTTPGARRNVLFMNVNGVLTDQTSEYAAPMLDETNDRDVEIADFNGDGWLDFVTVPTKGASIPDPPENIRQPRVYINLGNDPDGNWLGLAYEPDRMPLFSIAPGFCEAGIGDVDGANGLDIYFVDYSGSYGNDLDDRLVMNDGMGFFTDETTARLASGMPQSGFGSSAEVLDMSGDGFPEIMRDSPGTVSIFHNDGTGNFDVMESLLPGGVYFFVVGDFNNDNQYDAYALDDGQDHYRFGDGAGEDGFANFTAEIVVSGSPNTIGFGGNGHVVDLDKDGWNDLILAQNDVDIQSCGRPLTILRNMGDPPNNTLTDPENGNLPFWLPIGAFDAVPIDINGDTWMDMVVGTCDGTKVFMNIPPAQIFFSYPNGLPSDAQPDEPISFVIHLDWVESPPVAATLHYRIDNQAWQTADADETGENEFTATIPGAGCGSRIRYYVTAQNEINMTFTDPPGGAAEAHSLYSSFEQTVPINDNFENAVEGWEIQNDELTGGAWVRVNPNGTKLGPLVCQPEDDYNVNGTKCYVTGQGDPGGGAAVSDVDGGPTTLVSPLLDLENADAYVSYARWFFRFSGTGDALKVQITNDALNEEAEWVQIESVSSNEGEWVFKTFRVSEYVEPSSAVRVRFVISDNPADSITEGGVDAFKIVKLSCVPPCVAGDADGNGVVDTDDVDEFVAALVASDPQPACGSDVNGDNEINGDDIAVMVDLLIGS